MSTVLALLMTARSDCRHMHSTQTFIPMGKAPTAGEKALEDGGYYVVVVALSDSSERPDVTPFVPPTIHRLIMLMSSLIQTMSRTFLPSGLSSLPPARPCRMPQEYGVS